MMKLIKKTVFLAEGEKHVREALRLMLEHQADIEIAGESSTAESLLAKVCTQPPDVILLDWNLPGLHPQRLLSALHQCCPDTMILATSVKPEQKNTVEAYQVNGFLSKQLSPEDFMAVLMKFISI